MIGSTLATRIGGLLARTPPSVPAAPSPGATPASAEAFVAGASIGEASAKDAPEARTHTDLRPASPDGAADIGQTVVAAQAAFAAPDAALADLPATPAEIATALADGLVPRLVVLSHDRSGTRHEPGAVRLARQMRQSGLTTVVVDLTRGGEMAAFMGVEDLAPGFGDWQEGRALLSEAIHRDDVSAAHIVPAGGFDFAEADASEIADLVFLVVACCGVYDCVLMACETSATDRLPAILDDDTALILDRGAGLIGPLVDALEILGVEDWLELAPVPLAMA